MRGGRRGVLGAVGIALVGAPSVLAEAAPQPQRPGDPAFAVVEDHPALPRVLLIGDSISIGYTVPVRQQLAGKANVHRAPTNCGPTTRGLEQLDQWLAGGRWDVIHFNFGLHDLKRIDGQQQVPITQYEANLRTIVARLKKTGAKLIWASTTPVPPGELSPPRSNEDVVAYNAVARRVMEESGVAINDLYGFALPRLGEIQRPNNVHFTAEGSAALAEKVVQAIVRQLPPER